MIKKQPLEDMFPGSKYQQKKDNLVRELKNQKTEEDQGSNKTKNSEETQSPTSRCINNVSQIIKIFDGTHNPSAVNFRQKEQKQIENFIQDCLNDKLKCRCLLLTGMPGAGKTLLAKRILSEKQGIKTMHMNANVVMNQFINVMSKELLQPKDGAKFQQKRDLHQLLQALKKGKNKEKIFVFIDQFDSLFKGASANLLQIFSIFSSPVKNISMIGTSNSMEIMQTLSSKYKLSLPALKNIVFSPYTIQQIKNIILDRNKQVKNVFNFTINFDEIALRYATTKLSNIKGGDLRFVLEQIKTIVSRAMDDSKSAKECTVKFEHCSTVLTKLNKTIAGSDLMRHLPFQQSLVLIAIYQIYSRQECLQASLKQVQKQTSQVQKVLHLESRLDDISQMIKYLQTYGFISTREKKRVLHICLKAHLQTIKGAFEDDELLGRYFWE